MTTTDNTPMNDTNNQYNRIEFGECREVMKRYIAEGLKVQTCVTSPPYYGLRDYGTGTWEGGDPNCNHYRDTKVGDSTTTGHAGMEEEGAAVGDAIYKDVCKKCGAKRIDQQIGLEESPEAFVDNLVDVFRSVRELLHDDGTLWVNLGDSYYNYRKTQGEDFAKQSVASHRQDLPHKSPTRSTVLQGLKNKDLIGVPWMFAFAMRADGWYLRQDIIWCLSGGTQVYVQSQKGCMPMSIKDLTRLDPKTVKLWTGKNWTRVLGWGESTDQDKKIELVLRSGERIGTTGNHIWPTARGEVKARDLQVGDVIEVCDLPEPENPLQASYLTDDLLWLLGLYLAEGSRADDTVQLALNVDETSWLSRIDAAVKSVGGTMTHTIDNNTLNVRLYGKVINAVIDDFIAGATAKSKRFTNKVWQLPNQQLRQIIAGYLMGDAHWDQANDRYRLGFCRNYSLEQNLRTAAARLGATITLNMTFSTGFGKEFPSFRGEWRWGTSDHRNNKSRAEIVKIQKSRGRKFWDISVEDESHLFSLASGVLTHNCKPNPMPESVRDRCTKAHEYIFLFSKKPQYFFDDDAIKTKSIVPDKHIRDRDIGKLNNTPGKTRSGGLTHNQYETAKKRSVWTVNTKPYPGSHFAVYPEELIEPCVLAGSRFGDVVFDPFMGSGTTAAVAIKHGRQYLGTDLNPDYKALQDQRIAEAHRDKPPIIEGDPNSLFVFE